MILAERLDDLPGDITGHGRTAAVHLLQGIDKLGAWSFFQQVTCRSRSKGIIDVICVFIDRQHDELGLLKKRLQFANGFHSTDAWQVDIHEHDIRTQFTKRCKGSFGIAPLADELESGRTSDPTRKNFAGLCVVFNDSYGDAHVGFILHCFRKRLS